MVQLPRSCSSSSTDYTINNLSRVSGVSLKIYGTPVQTSEDMRGIYYHDFSTDNLPTYLWVYGLRGVSWWLCVCFTWHDMTTPPWCREKVVVYYYIPLRILVRYMWWFVGISGWQFFTSGTYGSLSANHHWRLFSVLGILPRNAMDSHVPRKHWPWKCWPWKIENAVDQRFVGGITVPNCSAKNSACGKVLIW